MPPQTPRAHQTRVTGFRQPTRGQRRRSSCSSGARLSIRASSVFSRASRDFTVGSSLFLLALGALRGGAVVGDGAAEVKEEGVEGQDQAHGAHGLVVSLPQRLELVSVGVRARVRIRPYGSTILGLG